MDQRNRASREVGRLWLAMWLGLALFAAGGCLPSRVTIDLSPGDRELATSPVLADSGASTTDPKIALIDVTGVISHGPRPGLLSSRGNMIDEVVARLDAAGNDPSVRGVVLRVNSPGGTVAASETLHGEVASFRARTGKPVIASMADLGTSGGYYVALAADRILAQPSTITGSIGVLVQTFNVSGGMDRVGIDGRAVTSGPNKALANPFEPPAERHYRVLQSVVDEFYGTFLQRVRDGRPRLDASLASAGVSLDDVADGRVFTGAEAARLGLIDGTGSIRDAFEQAKSLAAVDRAELIKYHDSTSVVRTPYASSLGGVATPAVVRGVGDGPGGTEINLLKIDAGARADRLDAGFYYLWVPPSP